MSSELITNIPDELQSMALETLGYIAKHSGKWTWYQLDRALSHDDNLPYMNKLIFILKQLEMSNLIMSDESESSSQPKYIITESGLRYIQTV